jgi:hypothetical protein
MYAIHNDRIQGILCAPTILTGQRAAHTGLLSRMRSLARALSVHYQPPKASVKVDVQFLASDDYIANPAELLHRFRPLDRLYADNDVALQA